MKSLLVGSGTTLGSISTSADMLDNSKLGDKVICCISSNSKVITASANVTADYRGQTFRFVQGRGSGMNPKNGIDINPFNFSYTVKPYVAKVAKIVKLGYAETVRPTSSIILAADCVAANIGRLVGIRVTVMDMPKPAYSNEVPYYEVTTQIKANDTVALVLTRLKAKLDVLFAKLGNGLTASSYTNSTVYYGMDFTATAGFNFTVKGMGLAELAGVVTTVDVAFGTGLGTDLISLEEECSTREGNNMSFHSNEILYSEEPEVVAATTYDVCLIETRMDPAYPLFQDHANVVKKQYILFPSGGSAYVPVDGATPAVPGTKIYAVVDVLNAIKAAN